MTECARATVGDQAILDRCARDLPLPNLAYVHWPVDVQVIIYTVAPYC